MLKRNYLSLLVIGLSLGVLLFAAARFGVIYTHSLGLDADERGDPASARTLWTISANLGYTSSKTMLGTLYLFGKGGAVDAKLADKYLLAASEDGDADAQSIYGMAIYSGANLPLDRQRGIFWLETAAAQGDRDARAFLNSVVGK